MKNFILLVCCLFVICCSAGSTAVRGHRTFTELSKNYRENTDFYITAKQQNSEVVVLAIHGGDIEKNTSLVASAIAGDVYNLYLFEVFGADAKKWHITSTKFNEPKALKLAKKSTLGLSMHAKSGKGEQICLGGGNSSAASLFAHNLRKYGFDIEYPCIRLPGVSPKNIVNIPAQQGVQFEITQSLLDRLAKEPEYLTKFTQVLRRTVKEYFDMNLSNVKN